MLLWPLLSLRTDGVNYLRSLDEEFVFCKIIKNNISDHCTDLGTVIVFVFLFCFLLLKVLRKFLDKLGLTLVPNRDNTEEMDESNCFSPCRTDG